ncbi:MAG: hypothetical protein QXK76_02665 [Candidatus Woesearchaeota archaeon]
MNEDLCDKIKTYEIIKKGLFVKYRAQREFEKIRDKIEVISITAYYDFRNPLFNEYKVIYKNKN